MEKTFIRITSLLILFFFSFFFVGNNLKLCANSFFFFLSSHFPNSRTRKNSKCLCLVSRNTHSTFEAQNPRSVTESSSHTKYILNTFSSSFSLSFIFFSFGYKLRPSFLFLKKCNKSEHNGIEYEKVREIGEKSRERTRERQRKKMMVIKRNVILTRSRIRTSFANLQS